MKIINTKTFLSLLLSITSIAVVNTVSAANLILNPGFETGTFASWSLLTPGPNETASVLTPNNGPSAPGSFDAYLDNTAAASNFALQQSTALGSASQGLVNFSFDLKVDSSLNGGVVFIHFWDINSTGGVIDQGPGLQGPYFNGSWNTYTGSWTAPAGVNHFEVEFDCTTGAAAGSAEAIEVDNVSLTQVPEPTTLALAGLGGATLLTLIRRRK